uniref:Cytochrome c oxidase subunit 2 n=1 Tax=Nuttallina californica TaxID=413430 RepID=A0A0E3DE41_9MOLL|nr:cytochrome c oxidase subunit II [Nuttallina californica]AIA77066.1 cytochrome c oxidase subunit II [Nuttallina californica]
MLSAFQSTLNPSTLTGQFFQDGASSLMEEMIFFHDHAMMILIGILMVILYLVAFLSLNKATSLNDKESHKVEFMWAIGPSLVLVFLLFPSIQLLYLSDEINQPTLTIKAVGHQWYWSYEYSDFLDINFSSYMMLTDDISKGESRLLEVDNRLTIPSNMRIRMLVTSEDVIHSWTVPTMGVKVDAVPGRLNQTGFLSNFTGLFFGQCSEICGANHSFMPIVLEVINPSTFENWVQEMIQSDS